MNFMAFFSYVLLMGFTPGPNNIMSMANASRYGFRRALPFNVGVFLGFGVLMSCCAAFSSSLYSAVPSIRPVMLCLGAAYMVWLAWGVLKSGFHGIEPNAKEGQARSLMLSAITMQFVNVKAIYYGLTVTASFILPHYSGFLTLAGFMLLLAAIAFCSTLCWALFGAAFEHVFKKRSRATAAVMALLLVYCAVSMLRDL